MPPMASPLAPLVVFSFEILTPLMPWVAVFNQISPWSSAQMLAKGAASAASKLMPVLWEQPQALEAPEMVVSVPSSVTYLTLSP